MRKRAETGNRIIYLILGLLLVIGFFMSITLLREVPPAASGSPHPEISGMQVGGDGETRIKGIELASFIVFSATFLICLCLIVLGVSKGKRTLTFLIPAGVLTLGILFIWYRVFDSYMDYLSTGKVDFILGFPEPTAWMIFGLWGGGALFTVIYVAGFRKFIYTKEDEAKLKEIVEEYNKEGGDQ